jgi:two-component system phosphate regulon sensor histidine kinase PhoR
MFRDPGLSELLKAGDATLTEDLESPLRDNEWLNCRVVPYGTDQKLVLVRDVTERITLNKIRRDFVANASHELRSPLTVINGYLESLADDAQIPEELVKPLSQMQSQARRMTSIVKELLELSRLEGDGRAPVDEVVNVGACITDAVEATRLTHERPAINAKIESQAVLLGARSDIDSILRNLLVNAVRHTPEQGEIDVIWRSDDENAFLIVRDTGEGIAPEHLPRLTERFFRVDRGRTRDTGGFGLGLAIVKHAVERHDGELQISSKPGAGSEFRCRFPAGRIAVTQLQ